MPGKHYHKDVCFLLHGKDAYVWSREEALHGQVCDHLENNHGMDCSKATLGVAAVDRPCATVWGHKDANWHAQNHPWLKRHGYKVGDYY